MLEKPVFYILSFAPKRLALGFFFLLLITSVTHKSFCASASAFEHPFQNVAFIQVSMLPEFPDVHPDTLLKDLRTTMAPFNFSSPVIVYANTLLSPQWDLDLKNNAFHLDIHADHLFFRVFIHSTKFLPASLYSWVVPYPINFRLDYPFHSKNANNANVRLFPKDFITMEPSLNDRNLSLDKNVGSLAYVEFSLLSECNASKRPYSNPVAFGIRKIPLRDDQTSRLDHMDDTFDIQLSYIKRCASSYMQNNLFVFGFYKTFRTFGGVGMILKPFIVPQDQSPSTTSAPLLHTVGEDIPNLYIHIGLERPSTSQSFGPPMLHIQKSDVVEAVSVGENLGAVVFQNRPIDLLSDRKLVLFFRCFKKGSSLIELEVPVPPFKNHIMRFVKLCPGISMTRSKSFLILSSIDADPVSTNDVIHPQYRVNVTSLAYRDGSSKVQEKVVPADLQRVTFQLLNQNASEYIVAQRLFISYNTRLLAIEFDPPQNDSHDQGSNPSSAYYTTDKEIHRITSQPTILRLRFICKQEASVGVAISILVQNSYPTEFSFVKICEAPVIRKKAYITAGFLLNAVLLVVTLIFMYWLKSRVKIFSGKTDRYVQGL